MPTRNDGPTPLIADNWPNGTPRRLLLGLFAVAITSLAAACLVPLSSAVQIGLDEHYELSKALLWARGFSLYDPIWNDQPPLFTVLLGSLFRVMGESIGVARALAALFGLSMLAAFFLVANKRLGLLAAMLGVALLIGAPQVLWLSTSAMLEVPAVGTALWSLWAVVRWSTDRRPRWLVLSGVLLAVAMQIKLTAIVVAPAIALEILLGTAGPSTHRRLATGLSHFAIWTAGIALATAGLVAVFGTTPPEILFSSHFSGEAAHALKPPISGVAFLPMLLKQHHEMVWLVPLAFGLVVLERDYRRLAFALAMLATVTGLYLFHRPFWEYYYLHVALPLGWLVGYAIERLFYFCWSPSGSAWRRAAICGATACVVLATTYSNWDRLNYDISHLRNLPRVADSRLIDSIERRADLGQQIFTRHTIYPFHAGVAVIPELAVLPRKRLAAGDMTTAEIWRSVRDHQPSLLLLDQSEMSDPETPSDWIASEYELAYSDDEYRLFALNSDHDNRGPKD